MQLRVNGLPPNASEDELVRLFSEIGRLEWVRIIRDIISGKSKGYAIVRMPVDAEAEEAIKRLSGFRLGDVSIRVNRMHETLPGEMEYKEWLTDYASSALERIGVRAGQSVLDYGCGPGPFSIASAGIVGGRGKVCAMDVRASSLEQLKESVRIKGLANIETMLLDKVRVSISLPDESIDVILLYDVLQEIPDKQGLIREFHRVLAQSGFLSIFPMHMGTDMLLRFMNDTSLFRIRDRYGPPMGFQSPSEVINFTKPPA